MPVLNVLLFVGYFIIPLQKLKISFTKLTEVIVSFPYIITH